MATRRKFLGGAGAFVGALLLPKPVLEAARAIVEEQPAAALTPAADIHAWATQMVASGGLCAPVTPYYDLPLLPASRLLRDALPVFQADRGGISFIASG